MNFSYPPDNQEASAAPSKAEVQISAKLRNEIIMVSERGGRRRKAAFRDWLNELLSE